MEKKVPLVEPEMVNIPFTKEELDTFSNLMTISVHTFQKLALQAASENDDASFNVFSARQKLSFMLANKLISFNRIGEPTSREMH